MVVRVTAAVLYVLLSLGGCKAGDPEPRHDTLVDLDGSLLKPQLLPGSDNPGQSSRPMLFSNISQSDSVGS